MAKKEFVPTKKQLTTAKTNDEETHAVCALNNIMTTTTLMFSSA